jgi:four helix bundle protein
VGSTPTRLRHVDFGFAILDFGLSHPMNEKEFKRRTKDIAVRIIALTESLPPTWSAEVIGKQLLRSGTSIGANYRAACRAKSAADILHKLAIVEEEADESLYWMELLIETKIVSEKKLSRLFNDINEIVAMTVASIKTLRSRKTSNPKSKIQNPKSKI